MPLRGDFETEHENDAELVLCDMVFNDDDPVADIGNRRLFIASLTITRNETQIDRKLQQET
jgi:hypothetical protein